MSTDIVDAIKTAYAGEDMHAKDMALADCSATIASLRQQVETLREALKEARGMLKSCGFEHPEDDPELVASWERGLARINAAIAAATRET